MDNEKIEVGSGLGSAESASGQKDSQSSAPAQKNDEKFIKISLNTERCQLQLKS